MFVIYCNYDLNKLGRLIKEKRVEKNLSLRQLEKLSGVSFYTIYCLEHFKLKAPRYLTIIKLAKVLKFKIKDVEVIR